MDIATTLGLVAGGVVLVTLIMMGGDLRMFADVHAAIVIFGGSFAATLIRFPLSSIFHGLPLGAKFAFTLRRITQRDLVDEIAGLAEIARKQGPLGLEKIEIEDPFLAKGIRFVADGYDNEFIRDNLERDRDNFLTHLDEGQKIDRAVGDCAPAFGMVGTLIGMVQMFANMTDPSKLGPYMAVALLATFYGAALANLFCLPIADKLHLKLTDEEINGTLIIDGVLMIREAKSPALVREMLLAYLPEKHRHQEAEPEPAAGLTIGPNSDGEETRRSTWQRSRLVRDLRGPDGPPGRVFRDAGGLLDGGPGEAADRGGLDARRLRRAGSRALFRRDRDPGPADQAEAQERSPHCARRGVGDADPRRAWAPAQLWRQIRRGPRVFARRGVAAPGHAGPAGHRRIVQAPHDRGDQAGTQYRDRGPGRPLDVSRKGRRSPTSARAG